MYTVKSTVFIYTLVILYTHKHIVGEFFKCPRIANSQSIHPSQSF